MKPRSADWLPTGVFFRDAEESQVQAEKQIASESEEIQFFTVFLTDLQATSIFGRLLGEAAVPGDVICLQGDLGAGKTTLTQAIAQGLEVPVSHYITSPSFAIFHEYPGRIPLYHMDFYRLQDAAEILDLGLDEYFAGSGVTVIEWPERGERLLPAGRLVITIDNPGDGGRILRCACPSRWESRFAELLRKYPFPASANCRQDVEIEKS